MLSRRELGGKLAAGTALILAAGTARASLNGAFDTIRQPADTGADDAVLAHESQQPAPAAASEIGPPETLTAKAPWDLLSPLALGATVSHGWSLSRFSGAVGGSCVVTLRNQRGRESRVHICQNNGKPQGLVYTKRFDLVVMNGGQGDLPTEEGLGQAVAELAHVIAANEDRQEAIVASLMPHAERVRMCSQMADHRLR